MRILFLPSDTGGGFGHISRCLALARECKSTGHTCAFVLNDTKYENKVGSDFAVYVAAKITSFRDRLFGRITGVFRRKIDSPPLYLMISGLDYQVVRDRFFTTKDVEYVLAEYWKVVRDFKPDVLVGDTNLLVWMLGRKADLPVVQVVRYASHPATAKLIWWHAIPENMIPPDSAALFNPILERAGLENIARAEDLLRGDLYMVPSMPELEPILPSADTQFVGGLLAGTKPQNETSWTDDWRVGDHPLIYVSIGGGASSVGSRMFFSMLAEAFSGFPARVVVSTGGKFPSESFSSLPANVRFFDWVPGRALISMADLVIFHGGYATMMETVAAGKPTIIVPFHSEQESNGRRLEQLGAGRVLRLSHEAFEEVKASWPQGTYSYLIQKSFDLVPDELRLAARDILADSEYTYKTQVLQNKIASYGGSSKAVDLIQKCCA